MGKQEEGAGPGRLDSFPVLSFICCVTSRECLGLSVLGPHLKCQDNDPPCSRLLGRWGVLMVYAQHSAGGEDLEC